MTSLQCINKILNTKNYNFVTANALDKTYFSPYEEEFTYINDHFNRYGNVPDKETFLSVFPDFETFEVTETDEYLLNSLNEEHLYSMAVPVIQKSAEILKGNSLDAVNYLMRQVTSLNKSVGVTSTDIIHQAKSRLDKYKEKRSGNESDFFINSGFKELDYQIHGWSRGEELVVFFARTNQGKSWVLAKCLAHAWRLGFNCGFISPEMSPDSIGYRVDTLLSHFDNMALNWGKNVSGYEEYINSLDNNDATFHVATQKDFGGIITVSKLKTFVQNNNLHILGIDGLTYIQDERRTRNDNQQAQLTHISEDLMQLSIDLKIPVVCVVQANRDGVKMNGGNLELENIRDADGIAYNASKVIAIRQKVDEEILELTVKKNRNGFVGGKFIYQWIPNTGDFNYVPSEDDGNSEEDREEQIQALRDQFTPKTGSAVF